jgi:multidrug resistance efflux pump
MVRSKRWSLTAAGVLVLLLATFVVSLIFIPWQQSVRGVGEVIIFNPMDRPQGIEAQISARLVRWEVVEGQSVTAGQTIAVLEDIDPRYLDPQLLPRVNARRRELRNRLEQARQRATNLENLIDALGRSRNAAVPGAEERAEQAKNRMKAAEESLKAARQTLKVAQEVATAAAAERVRQAKERINQAEQNLKFAEQRQFVADQNYDRTVKLERKGLRSQREKEVAEQDKVSADTGVEVAKQALEIVKRDEKISTLQENQANLEVARAQAEVGRLEAVLDEARRGVNVGFLDFRRMDADTAASISNAEANLAQVKESIAQIRNDILNLDVEYHNLQQRVGQRKVVAPCTGRVVRMLKVGAGETVKAGDTLAYIAPDTQEQMVELYVSDNDIPFVFAGAPVRLQFAGWPAITWVGFPSAAVGTFAGRVRFVDAIDDGKGRYRVLVAPDEEAIKSGKEQPWPLPNPGRVNDPMTMRVGAEVNGWVMLGQVKLGFELWRQLNAFPPNVDLAMKDKLGKAKDKDNDSEEKPKEEKVKRKIKLK